VAEVAQIGPGPQTRPHRRRFNLTALLSLTLAAALTWLGYVVYRDHWSGADVDIAERERTARIARERSRPRGTESSDPAMAGTSALELPPLLAALEPRIAVAPG
jgi:hypothetical protein